MSDDGDHDELYRDLGCVFFVLIIAVWIYAVALLVKMLFLS